MCKELAGSMKNSSNKFSVKSRIKSFSFAFRGLASLIKNEHNSRIHLIAAIAAVTAGILLKLNFYEWSFIIIVTGLVFVTELLNSALESLADKIGPEWSDLIMKSKDYSAAAVLISAIIALITGCLIFIPKILLL
jgi:diacylglycerol kinase